MLNIALVNMVMVTSGNDVVVVMGVVIASVAMGNVVMVNELKMMWLGGQVGCYLMW